ncbi:hypothetical protein [Runella slithyformis]|uniref:Uncharacterized protein n=1 Tax=Runella slithyformis (strain ATCC 29530 / DSM 19594 / LMG 11500 / NCIMB 11436 / LSU 4) TaxID=761193 RepID=A0A7U4E478_RUNSL|nr:hypothetical protein [Runella slithyformis]AEI46769.1 hypothetical protein Runsl_0317 [Runella slithyformis DSM 19594]
MVTTQNIGAIDQDSNAAYVRALYLLNRSQLEGLLDPVRFPNPINTLTVPVNALTVMVGTQLTKLDFLPRSCTFNESRGRDANGYYYDVQFLTEFPKDRYDVVRWLMGTPFQEYVALWEDFNGTAYITGTDEIGLEVQLSRTVGARNVIPLSITGRFVTPTYYLESIDLAELFPEADFSFHFSLQFNS